MTPDTRLTSGLAEKGSAMPDGPRCRERSQLRHLRPNGRPSLSREERVRSLVACLIGVAIIAIMVAM